MSPLKRLLQKQPSAKKETTQRRKGAGYSGKNFASLRLGVEAFC
jgi:hypothetical protein